jgi:hypothetical protein
MSWRFFIFSQLPEKQIKKWCGLEQTSKDKKNLPNHSIPAQIV